MQVITASTREGLGKEAARKVRNAGQIPACLLYTSPSPRD